jgi:hypothetical protein
MARTICASVSMSLSGSTIFLSSVQFQRPRTTEELSESTHFSPRHRPVLLMLRTFIPTFLPDLLLYLTRWWSQIAAVRPVHLRRSGVAAATGSMVSTCCMVARYFHRVSQCSGKAASNYRSGSREKDDWAVGTPDLPASSDSSCLLQSRYGVPVASCDSDPSEGFPTRSWYRVLLCSSMNYCGAVSVLASPNSSLNSGLAKCLLFEHLSPKTLLCFQRLSSLAANSRTLRLRSSSRHRILEHIVGPPYAMCLQITISILHTSTANGHGQTFLGVYDHCVDTLQASQ